MKKSGIILTVVLSVILVLAVAVGGCYFTAAAEPKDARFDYAISDETLDVEGLLGNLVGGEVVIPCPIVNAAIQEALKNEPQDDLNQLLMMPDETAEDALWARAWVNYKGREWVVTVRMHLDAVTEQEKVTQLRLTPEQITVGRLPVPEMLWPVILKDLADEADLAYEGTTIIFPMTDLDTQLVQVKDLHITSEGFVFHLGINWGDVDWGDLFQ